MSEEKSWINPCGLIKDDRPCKKIKISPEEKLPGIKDQMEVSLEALQYLKKYMDSAFKNVDEATLISRKYTFLNPPKNMENIYVCSYHILQVDMMAVELLLKETDNDKYKHYHEKLNDFKDKLKQLLCNIHVILLSECLTYEDVKEDLMSESFKHSGNPIKMEKHFIAIRQIKSNMQFILKKFYSMDQERIQGSVKRGAPLDPVEPPLLST